MVRIAIGLAALAAIALVAALVANILPLAFVAIASSFAASTLLRVHLFRKRTPRH